MSNQYGQAGKTAWGSAPLVSQKERRQPYPESQLPVWTTDQTVSVQMDRVFLWY